MTSVVNGLDDTLSTTRYRPAVAFGGAILIAIGGFVIGGGTGRVTIALVGTLAAGRGWYLTERPPVRNGIRSVVGRIGD